MLPGHWQNSPAARYCLGLHHIYCGRDCNNNTLYAVWTTPCVNKKCRSEHYTLFPLSAHNSRPPSALQEGLGARLGLPSMWSAANVLTAACAIQNTNCYRLPYLTSSLHHSLHSFTMDNWYNYITRSHLEPADIMLTTQTTSPQQGYYWDME